MAREGRTRFWRKCRVYFRRLRIAILLFMLGVLGALIYLELHGLPGFIQRPLLEKLRTQGVALDFSRLRLRWSRGIVAENVSFGSSETPSGPRLTAKEVEIHIDPRALTHFQVQVDQLELRKGKLTWPVGDTNSPATNHAMMVENIDGRLRLMPGDEWVLDDLRAHFAGAHFFVSGSVTNASAIRDWKFLQARPPTEPPQWPERLRRLSETLDRISFTTPPELRLHVDGDARDLQSFTARLTLESPDADTPWGQATNILLRARLFPGAGGELSHCEMHLRAAAVSTPWADASRFELEMHLDTEVGDTNLVDGNVTVRAAHAVTQWAAVTNVQFAGNWIHSFTNPVPLSGQGQLRAGSARTRWINGDNIRLGLSLGGATNVPLADASWAWWVDLQPYDVAWECEADRVAVREHEAREIVCSGRWHAPQLIVSNLLGLVYDGALSADGNLNVATREAQFSLSSDFDPQKASSFLPEAAAKWLAQYSWEQSPRVRGSGLLILPAWTNHQADWDSEVMPTMKLAGELAVTNGAYLGLKVDWATTHILLTNNVWSLPDLEIARPDGRLHMVHIADDNTRDYYFRIQSTMDLRGARPLLSTNAQSAFDFFAFTQPPMIDGELWGRWRDNDRIGFKGRVALTNFAFREQAVDAVVARMQYTNRVLQVFEPLLWRGTQTLSATGITADFNTQRIHFTNGFSTTDPMAVARAIGPMTARDFSPYVFKQPPTAFVEGYVPLGDMGDADLRVTADGGPFEWWKFKLPHIKGNLRWKGDTLLLTNVQTDFYWGNALGNAEFDVGRQHPGTDFKFSMSVANAQLQMLMADLMTETNKLQGLVTGNLVVTNANSDNMHSWDGYGKVRLRDGLIWSIPVFGFLSKPLDNVLPGLGSSTVSDGTARFSITNGVIVSNDLEMKASVMRLHYDGIVDFDGRVNARVEAEPLRDAWVIGRVLSLALWPVAKMWEYKVTGTLSDPKTEPLYIPKVLRAPFHPIQTLEGAFSNEDSRTNPPSLFNPR